MSYVVRPGAGQSYAPANHTGTANQRIISKDSVGAAHIEVLIGTITKGSGASRHAHPHLEQASYLLQGGGTSEVQGVVSQLKAGQWSLKPQGAFHRFDVTSDEPMKIMVIYSPPYLENPKEAIRYDETNPQPEPPVFVPAAGAAAALRPCPGITLSPVFTPQLSGSRHLGIYDGAGERNAQVGAGLLQGRERVFYVKTGRLVGTVQNTESIAQAGDFVFVPEGAPWSLRCDAQLGASFLLIDAYSGAPLAP